MHDPLAASVAARLDARLDTGTDAPLIVALSGGGDSVALLRMTADWAARRGRRVLALTVDHGLNPDSADWTRTARRMAHAVGTDWRGLTWEGAKPATGLTAAARAARHRLIADAARDVGARVVLMAHTRDDIREGEWMRARGSTLGRLREWAPSPVWPEGRGLMLLRPMLNVGRGELRDWLKAREADWIEDPANADPRFGRSRARAALADEATPPVEVPATAPSTIWRAEEGVVSLPRAVDGRTLAAALVAAGGGDIPARGDRLAALKARLASVEAFTATLCGARIEAADAVQVMRDIGRRKAGRPILLPPGEAIVWDGRWRVRVAEPGWRVTASAGLRASLSDEDRKALKALPPAARTVLPVLIRDGGGGPILAGRAGSARSLVEQRLRLALDMTTHERDLAPPMDGAGTRAALSCRVEARGGARAA